jgi:hypothetical protein
VVGQVKFYCNIKEAVLMVALPCVLLFLYQFVDAIKLIYVEVLFQQLLLAYLILICFVWIIFNII